MWTARTKIASLLSYVGFAGILSILMGAGATERARGWPPFVLVLIGLPGALILALEVRKYGAGFLSTRMWSSYRGAIGNSSSLFGTFQLAIVVLPGLVNGNSQYWGIETWALVGVSVVALVVGLPLWLS